MDLKFLTGESSRPKVKNMNILGDAVNGEIGSTSIVVAAEQKPFSPRQNRPQLPMPPFSHRFYTIDNHVIVAYDFTGLNVNDVPCSDLFRVGDNFKDKEFFKRALKCYAAMCGFCTRCKNPRVQECTRAGKPPTKNRPFSAGNLKCDCKFKIVYRPCFYEPSIEKQKDGSFKKVSRPIWDDGYFVEIMEASVEHTGGCKPCPQQHMMQKSRSGKYISDISQQALYTLCNASYDGRTVDTQTIRSIIRKQLPENKQLTSQNVYNIKRKVSRLLPRMENCTDYQSFKELMNTPIQGSNELHADNQNESLDEACKVFGSVWKEVMNNHNQSESETLVSFTEYMEIMTLRDKDFAYQILADSEGEVTGCIWMTSTMRKNFELFGGFCCVDAMKRDLNTLLWPYVAVTMYNEMDSVCVGCEGIVLSEREEAYKAMLDFQVTHSRRKRNEVYGISSDGFLNQSIIHRFGFKNTIFVMDYWHLFQQVLPKRFGRFVYSMIEIQLRNMANAISEKVCKKEFEDAIKILRSRCKTSELSIHKLTDLYKERLCFARYSIQRIPSSRGRRGSTCAESNHSSIVIHLNDGKRSVSTYTEHPTTLFRDLLKRQSEHIKKWNAQLFNEDNLMNIQKNRLESSSPRYMEIEEAVSFLCYKSFMRFQDNWHRANNDYILHIGNDSNSDNCNKGEKKMYVRSLKSETTRVFVMSDDGNVSRCDCNLSLGYEEQCIHEIVIHGMKFKKELFAEWHQRRSRVSCATVPENMKENVDLIQDTSPRSVQEALNMAQGKNPFVCKEETSSHTINHSYHDDRIGHGHRDNDECSTYNRSLKISKREIINITGEFCGNLQNASDETQIKLFGLMLDMNKAARLDGKQNTVLNGQTVNHKESVDELIYKTVESYKKSFLPRNGNFQPVSLSLSIPNRSVRARQVHKRIMPTAEKNTLAFKCAKKSKPTCSFCKEQNHRVNNCLKRRDLSKSGNEFVLCNEFAYRHQYDKLIDGFEQSANLKKWSYEQQCLQERMDVSRGYKHLVIEEAFSVLQRRLGMRFPMGSMYFRINYIDDLGNVTNDGHPVLVSGDVLKSYLLTSSGRKTRIFVYDKTSHVNCLTTKFEGNEKLLKSPFEHTQAYNDLNKLSYPVTPDDSQEINEFLNTDYC